MSPAEANLSEILTGEYGVPFDVSVSDRAEGLAVSARPSSDVKDVVRIEASVSNDVRLHVIAETERFGRPLIDTLASANGERKERCAAELRDLERRTRKLTFAANSLDLTHIDPNAWPDSWDTFEYSFQVFPLSDHDDGGLVDEVCGWVVDAFRPVFDLLEFAYDSSLAGFDEGDARRVELTKYERDPRNRRLCILARGCSCAVCGFDFENTYGELGRGFIHVHHIVPVSVLGPGYRIDPARDLIPVCPNCHAMLHRKNPPLTPEELRGILRVNAEADKQDK